MLCAGGLLLAARIHPFLAVSQPVGGDILVVEGWLPGYALEEALAVFRQQRYRLLVTTGGPLGKGSHLSDYATTAELAAASLRALGGDPQGIVAVAASAVRADRTYASALALAGWLSGSGLAVEAQDVVSRGAHARRTRLLFHRALGTGVRAGRVAVAARNYDAERWWAWSDGVRSVVSETVAYLYARFLFADNAAQPAP